MAILFDPHLPNRRPTDRWLVAATSVLAALVLHLAALGAVGAVVAQWQVDGAASGPSRWATTFLVLPRAPADALPEPARGGAIDPDRSAGRRIHRQPGRESTSLLQAPSTAAPAAADTYTYTDTDTDTDTVLRYYTVGEVDRPAMPDSDWNLDTAALDAAGLGRMVFDVFISSTGAVVACTILEPTALAEDTRKNLEGRLQQTVLQPALRAGWPVPSVRRIEMSVLGPVE